MKFRWTLAPPQPLLAGQLAASLQTVSVTMAVTWYGSMLALGRRSSNQPFFAFATQEKVDDRRCE